MRPQSAQAPPRCTKCCSPPINGQCTKHRITVYIIHYIIMLGAVVQLVEYRTRNQEVAGSTHTRSTANNIEQVANLLCDQANSASYPQRDGK